MNEKQLLEILRMDNDQIQRSYSEDYSKNKNILYARLLKNHPLPWHIGMCHESMATLLDADNKEVAILNGKFTSYPSGILEIMVYLLNKCYEDQLWVKLCYDKD